MEGLPFPFCRWWSWSIQRWCHLASLTISQSSKTRIIGLLTPDPTEIRWIVEGHCSCTIQMSYLNSLDFKWKNEAGKDGVASILELSTQKQVFHSMSQVFTTVQYLTALTLPRSTVLIIAMYTVGITWEVCVHFINNSCLLLISFMHN